MNRCDGNKLSATVERAAGKLLSQLLYRETYRDPKKDGPDKKRVLITLVLQSRDQTLTSDQADELIRNVITAAESTHAAKLLV